MSSRRLRTACLLLAVLLLARGNASAQPAVIVGPNDSIQQVIDEVPPGTMIQLEQGTYAQSVTINKDGLTLKGLGVTGVTIDGRGLADSSGIHIVDADHVTLENLTVRGFAAYDVLIGEPGRAGSGGRGHALREITATGARLPNGGQGIGVYAAQDVTIEHCAPSGNPIGIAFGSSPDCGCTVSQSPTFDNSAAGLVITDTSHLRVDGSEFAGGNVGILVGSSGPEVDVIGNAVHDNSQGVLVAASEGVRLGTNHIADNNRASTEPMLHPAGHGVSLSGASDSTVELNWITGHTNAAIELSRDTRWSAGTPSSGNVICRNLFDGNRLDIVSDPSARANRAYCIVLPGLSLSRTAP
jgi:hypothetical protein